jgi:Ca-activated chloride channel family protein
VKFVPPFLLSIAFLLITPALAFLQSGEFRIATNVDLVLLDVSVREAKGASVSRLSKENFKVFENGIAQKITSFSSADVPVEAGLVLDDSGSVRNKRFDVNVAGLTFVNASNPRDQIFVLDFNDKVLWGLPEGVPFTDNVDLLRQALSLHPAEGRTVLYDAVAAALHHLESGEREKKTLVVVSDGGDNASKVKLPQLMHLIEESHATIYTVGIYDPDDPDRNPGVLQRIAGVSGGECFLLRRYEDIVPTCRKIAEDIRKRYTIGYIPEGAAGKPGLRRIRVTASSPDHGRLVVRTRSSYFNPRAD